MMIKQSGLQPLVKMVLLGLVVICQPAIARETPGRDRPDREQRQEARADARMLRFEERLRLREERLDQAVRNGELSADDANVLRRKQRERLLRRQAQDEDAPDDDASVPWRRRLLAP